MTLWQTLQWLKFSAHYKVVSCFPRHVIKVDIKCRNILFSIQCMCCFYFLRDWTKNLPSHTRDKRKFDLSTLTPPPPQTIGHLLLYYTHTHTHIDIKFRENGSILTLERSRYSRGDNKRKKGDEKIENKVSYIRDRHQKKKKIRPVA